MTDPNLTHITVILDRSGSMAAIDSDTVGGFNTFVEEQQKAPGEATMTLIRFDNDCKADYTDKPIKDVPKLRSVEPRGMTAMLDAIGKSINELGEKLAKLPEEKRPSRVIVVIITDGEENASKEFNHVQIKEMVEHQHKKYAWQFSYLGANQDAVLAARNMGISAANSSSFVGANVRCAFAAASHVVGSYRSLSADAVAGGAQMQGYSATDRENMVATQQTRLTAATK
jgi:hypothetical protein